MTTEPDITVVGIGADGWAGLSGDARAAITAADVLFGSPRQLDLVPGDVEKLPWPSPLLPNLDGMFAAHTGRRICVLASGDPLTHGIGTTLVRRFGESVRVLPALSSVTLARARLGWSAERTEVISVVARDPHRVLRALAPGARLLVLSEDAHTPATVAGLLTEVGYGDSELTVLAELGGPNEHRITGTARTWSHPPGAALNVLAIDCVSDPETVALPTIPGLPDDAFEHDGQLSKRDVRAAALARLAPLPGELLWDIGAGAGSVGIEWSRTHPANRAVAVERNPERAARIARNANRLGVPELRVVTGDAPAALAELPAPDAVFVGGGLIDGVLETCLRTGARLVAHAVTLEAERRLGEAYAEHGGELVRIAVEQAAPLGAFTGFAPARTVTQWSLSKPSLSQRGSA